MNTRKFLVPLIAIASVSLSACLSPSKGALSTLAQSEPTIIPPTAIPSQSAPCVQTDSTWFADGGQNKFDRPTDLARDSLGNLYAIDGGNHRIQKFDCNGKFLLMFGNKGNGEGQFVFLDSKGHFGSIAVDSQNNVYVADHNFRIQKFDENGKFITQWGNQGSGEGQFGDYIALAVDKAGNLYVTDPVNSRIQKFNREGKFLLQWASPKCSFFTPRPSELAVDSQGVIYVTDPHSHCIQKFDSNGKFISTIGQFSETDLPTGIDIDSRGNIYISDDQKEVLKKLNASGDLVWTWDNSTSPQGHFDGILGVAVDESGNVYVVEVRGARLWKIKQP